MPYLVRGETPQDAVVTYLLEALAFTWDMHDSGSLNWHDEPGYVQWAGWPDGIQIECSSEAFHGRSYSEAEQLVLADAGFQAPTATEPNFWQRIDRLDDLPNAALALMRCMYEVLNRSPQHAALAYPEPTAAEPAAESLPSAAPDPAPELNITVPAVLLRVSQLWYPGIDEDSLYDATHGWWVMGPKRERAEYAFAVAKGTVRGVYRIFDWRSRHAGDAAQPGKLRWGFDGEPCDELSHLIGLDVSQYFPPGAANPVRYVNCDAPAAESLDRAALTPESEDATRLPTMAAICQELESNPVLHMSLGSKELFHSNVLAWLLQTHSRVAHPILSPWLQPDPARVTFAVRRESHNLDLVVELPHHAPLVIENKVFDLPDEGQLDRYSAVNIPGAVGPADLTKVLLSLTDPGWEAGEHDGWTWVSYSTLAQRVRRALHEAPHPDPFSQELVTRWADVVEGLERLVAFTDPQDTAEALLIRGDEVEILKTLRLHNALQKFRTRRVRSLLETYLAVRGLQYDLIESEFTKGTPLISVFVRLADEGQIGWQLQGNQFRRFLIVPPHLRGTSEDSKAQRVIYAREHHASWFDFTVEQELGPFSTAPTADFKHFAPGFVYDYDYLKVPGISIQQLLELGTCTLGAAIAYRDG